MVASEEKSDVVGIPNFETEKGIFSLLNDAVILLDEQFTIRYWNEAATKIYRRTLPQVINRFLYAVTRYEFIQSNEIEAVDQLKTTGHWSGLVKIFHDDGRSSYLETVVRRIPKPVGANWDFVAVNRDITQQYEATLSISNYTSLLNSIEETYIVLNAERRVVVSHFKPVTAAFYGFTYKVGEYYLDRIPANRHAPIAGAVDQAFTGKSVSYDVSSPLMQGVVLQVTYLPIYSSAGLISHVCTVVKDVSEEREIDRLRQEQRKSENRLFEARKLFEEFMQRSPILAWIADSKGMIKFMNGAQRQTLQLNTWDTLQSIDTTFPGALGADLLEQVTRTITKGETVDRIFNYPDQNENRSLKAVIFPINIHRENMAACWSVDVTAQVRTQQQLTKFQEIHQHWLLETMIDAQESERDNVSRLLRDSINQTLASCKVFLELSGDNDQQIINSANLHLENAIQQIREISETLDPVTIDHVGLALAVETMVSRSSHQIIVSTRQADEIDRSLSRPIQLGAYRILQKILSILEEQRQNNNYTLDLCLEEGNLLVGIEPWDMELAQQGLRAKSWNTILVRIASLDGNYAIEEDRLVIALPLKSSSIS